MKEDERMILFNDLVKAVLNTPGDTSSALRTTIAQQVATRNKTSFDENIAVPFDLQPYVTKVATHAYKVTDQDVDQLRANYSEDAIFEITVSTALGAGLACLTAGLDAVKGTQDANKEN